MGMNMTEPCCYHTNYVGTAWETDFTMIFDISAHKCKFLSYKTLKANH